MLAGDTMGRDASCTNTMSMSSSAYFIPFVKDMNCEFPPGTIFLTLWQPNNCTIEPTCSNRSFGATIITPSISGQCSKAVSEYDSTGLLRRFRKAVQVSLLSISSLPLAIMTAHDVIVIFFPRCYDKVSTFPFVYRVG